MDYNRYQRRPKRKITGRFYAFITVMLVLCVMLGVLINTRLGGPRQPGYFPAVAEGTAPTAAPTEQPTPVPQPPVLGETEGQNQTPTDPQSENGQTSAEPDPTGTLVYETEELPPLSKEEQIEVDNLHPRTDLPSEWRNFLLLGSDSRNADKYSGSLTDTMIIASLNTTTGQVKTVSILRDMMIEIPGKGMQKINSAFRYGGPDLLMQLINENLGMNITQYAIINFGGMAAVIDILGGVILDITKEEQAIINNHIGEIARYTMDQKDYLAQRESLKMQTYGSNTRLTGMQAVTFARIRKDSSDFERTSRQRRVIEAMLVEAKDANVIQVAQIIKAMWPHLKTTVDLSEAVTLGWTVMGSGLKKVQDWRLPGNDTFKSETRNGTAAFWDVDYAENTLRLHDFIYGERFP